MKVYSYRSKDAGGSLGTFTTLGELCAALNVDGHARIGERLQFIVEVLEVEEAAAPPEEENDTHPGS